MSSRPDKVSQASGDRRFLPDWSTRLSKLAWLQNTADAQAMNPGSIMSKISAMEKQCALEIAIVK